MRLGPLAGPLPAPHAFGADFDLAQATGEPGFTVDLDGFERPLDLLLGACPAARKLRLELAADYLVMAAWLASLKSRLLSGTFERSTEGERPLHCNCCSGLPLGRVDEFSPVDAFGIPAVNQA